MKQLGLVRAGSHRERSALTKSEARKFINQLIDQMLATTLPLVTRMFLLVRVVEFASQPENLLTTTRINSTSKHG
jgi:hypothetical protein